MSEYYVVVFKGVGHPPEGKVAMNQTEAIMFLMQPRSYPGTATMTRVETLDTANLLLVEKLSEVP